jgi:agmatine/peptidylarginine deiminase
MARGSEKYAAYMATPFWDIRLNDWLQYANALRGTEREVLSHYPFRWVYAPPHDGEAGVEFLRDHDLGDVQVASIEDLQAKLPTFEALRAQGSVEWIEDRIDEAPCDGFRQIPEWEPMAGLLIHWPTLYPPLWKIYREVIAAFDHTTTFLRIPEGHFGATVLAWLEAKGIDLAKVRPIPSPISDIWAKDYSPFYGVDTYTGDPVAHKFAYAANCEGDSEFDSEVNEIDEKLNWIEGFESYRTEIRIDAGMIQTTDGNGTYILTRRVLWDNAEIPNLHAKLTGWLGADELIFIDEQPGDILGHINHFRFVAPQKVMLGVSDEKDTPVDRYLSALRAQFDERGYEVIEIPYTERFEIETPFGGTVNPVLYANCVMMNDRVIVPIFDMEGAEPYNERAVEAYQRALPKHRIIPLDVSVLSINGGGIYCGSKEIPDLSQLRTA